MKKTKELISLNLNIQGTYIAGCYDATENIFFDLCYQGYSKKEVFYLLRNKEGVIVPRAFYSKV